MAQNPKSVNLQTNGDVENIKGTPKQRTILIVVIVLLILSIVLLSIRLADYAQASEREVSLQNNSDSQIHLFSMHYENENGEVIIQSDQGDKVVAPGVGSTYTIRLRNTDEYALDYLIDPHIAVVGSKSILPLPTCISLTAPVLNSVLSPLSLIIIFLPSGGHFWQPPWLIIICDIL